MCLGEYGTVIDTSPDGRATVRCADGATRSVSLAVLIAEGIDVVPGDSVMVSIGMALHVGGPFDVEEQAS